jgi:hypothetical protein
VDFYSTIWIGVEIVVLTDEMKVSSISKFSLQSFRHLVYT